MNKDDDDNNNNNIYVKTHLKKKNMLIALNLLMWLYTLSPYLLCH